MSEKQFETMPPNSQKKKQSFLARRLNTLVALFVILAVLVAGYFLVKPALTEEVETPTTTEEPITLLPGEVKSDKSLLVYPSVDQKDIDEVRIHNPELEEKYRDWGIKFLYNDKEKRSLGYILGHENDIYLDETKLTLFAAAAGNVIFTRRVVDVCEDYSIYGLSEEEATRVEVKLTNGTVYTVYIGNLNPSGTAYYLRSGDTATDENGNPYERKAVYLLTTGTTTYMKETLAARPTAMLSPLLGYPVNFEGETHGLGAFELFSVDGSIKLSFRPVPYKDKKPVITDPGMLFGSQATFYTVEPAGYFSGDAFTSRIKMLEKFQGSEVVEYGTKPVTVVGEDGIRYEYYDFETDVLAKYGLDGGRVQYIMHYVSAQEDDVPPLESDIWFSDLQPDGYYYARSLNFNIIAKVDPLTVDFLGWKTLDFLTGVSFRMNIGDAAKVTLKGMIDGELFEESFVPSSKLSESEYLVQSVRAEKLNKQLSLTNYRYLFVEFMAITLQDHVPAELDREALLKNEPYFEMRIETQEFKKTGKYPEGLDSVTRIFRFYQYTNGRALATVETVDANGKSSGENGSFYVRISHLDQILSDAKKLCNGEEISYRDKE